MESAEHAVQNDGKSVITVAKEYGVPRKILSDKFPGIHPWRAGGQLVFTTAEENERRDSPIVSGDNLLKPLEKSGFQTSDLLPLSPQEVTTCTTNANIGRELNDTLVALLKKKKRETTTPKPNGERM